MARNFSVGNRVVLISFNGKLKAPKGTATKEDYWKLLGVAGTIANSKPIQGIGRNRVLVQFEVSPAAFGLECHNQPHDALWVRRDDLRLKE